MPLDPTQAAAGVKSAEAIAEVYVPALVPFDPLIALITTAIISHFNATKTWPSPEEVRSALPTEWAGLQTDWAAWKPSGDGTLKP